MSRTIAALSTPEATGAIALVRLSGPEACKISDAVFRPKAGSPLSQTPPRRACYGTFVADGEVFDDGIAVSFHAPSSYTGEDMVELSCHGNPLLARRLVAACIAAGAAPAGRGEFTRRAFENGKLDLSAAEAVAELIEAESLGAARAALSRRYGALEKRVDGLCENLAFFAAQLAVWADYPEEADTPAVTREGLLAGLSAAQTSIGKLLHSYPAAQLLAHGATVALVGSPNVGKSTLMNLLLGSERSIVTDIPGTTRDVVEGTLEAGGATLRLLDTAGIRDTTDVIERIGVARARNALETADLILLVLDRSHCPNQSDAALLASVMERPHVVALNKTDLPPHPGWEAFAPYVEISAATGEGGSALRMAIDESLGLSGAAQAGLAANERQYDCLVRSNEALVMAMDALMEGVTLDAVGIVLDDAIAPLCELTGRTASETVLGQVFSKFCVGK